MFASSSSSAIIVLCCLQLMVAASPPPPASTTQLYRDISVEDHTFKQVPANHVAIVSEETTTKKPISSPAPLESEPTTEESPIPSSSPSPSAPLEELSSSPAVELSSPPSSSEVVKKRMTKDTSDDARDKDEHIDLDVFIIPPPPVVLQHPSFEGDLSSNSTLLLRLCQDFLRDNSTCAYLYDLCRDEKYIRLTWEVTSKVFFERPYGIVMFLFWTVFLSLLNMVILFLCTLLRPLRSLLLNKIVSDLRRRYYFTNDSSELRVVDNKK